MPAHLGSVFHCFSREATAVSKSVVIAGGSFREGLGGKQSRQKLVGGQGQKGGEVVGERDALEDLACLGDVRHLGQGGDVLVEERTNQLGGHRCPVLEGDPVVDPLPHLGPADLGGRGVLHQVVD